MLVAIWNMLSTGYYFTDSEGDHFTRLDPDKAKNRAIDQLKRMEFAIMLDPLAVAG